MHTIYILGLPPPSKSGAEPSRPLAGGLGAGNIHHLLSHHSAGTYHPEKLLSTLSDIISFYFDREILSFIITISKDE